MANVIVWFAFGVAALEAPDAVLVPIEAIDFTIGVLQADDRIGVRRGGGGRENGGGGSGPDQKLLHLRFSPDRCAVCAAARKLGERRQFRKQDR